MSKPLSQLLILGLITTMATLFTLTRDVQGQEAILAGAMFALLALSFLLEHLRPFNRDWNASTGDLGGDVISAGIIIGVLEPALKWGTPFVILALVSPPVSPLMPLWAEVIIVTLLIELGAYVSHRLHHSVKGLWALHAVHHSPTRLYTLNNFRFSPLNHIINHAFMIVPVLALGFSAESVLAYTAISAPLLLLQHTNFSFQFGGLNLVFNTNQLHRWHHSATASEGNFNLGRSLIIWDRVFGTYYNPQDRAAPARLGLFSASRSFPAVSRFGAQLVYPFTKACCARA
ncbi:MAG: sterol desaturase family protein [Paracoccaceae bacterium]